jgi:hypothetical protein
MERLDEGLELGAGEELQLIEEEDDPPVVLLSCLADGDQEVGEVLT